MRIIEGDAKVFQTSAVGTIIRTLLGLGLIGLGIVAIAGSILPDRKPKNRRAKPGEKLSVAQRVGLGLFGGMMGFIGLFLAAISLLFPNKLHVTVWPDRVEMASTYSQTGGKELVIPFAGLASVELREETNVVGRIKTYLVFTQKNGDVVKQGAGNNERQALIAIQQTLEAYQAEQPTSVEETATAVPHLPETVAKPAERPSMSRREAAANLGRPKAESKPKEYSLKRYAINIPVPTDYSIVGPETVIEVGTKLKACYARKWSTVTVVATNDDGTITCNWDSFPTYTYKMMREDLIVANQNATEVAAKSPSTQYSLKRYKIDIPIPNGHALVAADTKVRVGMKLQACYAGRWEFVTVVAVNDDETITCNWDKWQSFTYKMLRQDLIIADEDAQRNN
ncbi:hypothetical protein [Aureliella helgolandensis]|nr:hypothetical protein [Aureliella helgolandensis]